MSGCEHGTKCCDPCREARTRAGFAAYISTRRGSEAAKSPKLEFRPTPSHGVPRTDPRWGWGW